MLVISGDHAEKCELSSHIRGNTVSRVGGRFGTFFGIFVGVVSRAIFLIGFHLGTLGASNLEVCGYLFVIQSIWGWILGPAAGGARVRVPGSGRPSRPCFFQEFVHTGAGVVSSCGFPGFWLSCAGKRGIT